MDFKESDGVSLEKECRSWWIRTRYSFLARAIASECGDRTRLRVLEMGCGTGVNLKLLREDQRFGSRIEAVIGADSALPDVSGAQELRSRPGWSWLRQTDHLGQALPPATRERSFDVLVIMDVLEHLPDPAKGLQDWLRWVKPGGLVFVTVPALQMLWSEHDRFLGHYRRYSRAELERLLRQAGLVQKHCAYAFSYLFPAFLLRRWLLRASAGGSHPRKFLFLAAKPLTWIGRLDAAKGGCRWFGTTVVGSFRLPGQGLELGEKQSEG